jgi:hypothetical protein
MYYLSNDTETRMFKLSEKHFNKEFITAVKEAVKPLDIENDETIIPTVKVSPRLYNESCERMGIGREHHQKHLVVWENNLVIGIINDNGTDQRGDAILSGERISMSGALQH